MMTKEERQRAADIFERKCCMYKCPNWFDGFCADKECAIHKALAELKLGPDTKEGEWQWFEEWLPSTTTAPAECEDAGWKCSCCETSLAEVVDGYWDDPYEYPKLKYCPECGAKMKYIQITSPDETIKPTITPLFDEGGKCFGAKNSY